MLSTAYFRLLYQSGIREHRNAVSRLKAITRDAILTLTATLVLRQQASGGKDTFVPCGVQIKPPSADTAAAWLLG